MVSRWWYVVSIGYLVSCWRALSRSTSVFWLVQSHLWPLFFLLPRYLFFCSGMWCLTYSFPSLFVWLLVCSLLGWWVPCAVFHCWKYAWVVDLSLQACSNITLEDVTVLGECCPSGRDSSLNLFFLVFVSGAFHPQSRSECCWHILVCRFPSSPLSLTCSSSEPDFHFQLIPVAFVVAHVVVWSLCVNHW